MKTNVIIVAAGQGTRFKSALPKPFVLLKGKPLIHYSLTVFESCSVIDGVVIVAHKDFLPRFQALCKHFKKIKAVVSGGETRSDSVKCGLSAVDAKVDYILVHDAARPLIDNAMIKRVLLGLDKNKAVIAAVPVKSTIKQVNRRTHLVETSLQRDLLWDVQTPQGFHRSVLIKAHAKPFKGEATDDAMLVEQMGVKVNVVMGDYRNIKVTTPEDLNIAKTLLTR